MALAIRELARQHRDELVVVLQCYARFPSWVARSIEQGLKTLGLDYADVLLLGWHDKLPSARLLDAVEAQREKGRFRYLAISSHQRPLFRTLLHQGRYDIFQEYTARVNDQSTELATLRGLFNFREGERRPVPIDEVEPVREIGKRFDMVPLGEHARQLLERQDLPVRAVPEGAGE